MKSYLQILRESRLRKEEVEKKDMSKGDIAALAGHKGKVDAADFKALRNKEHLKKEGNEMSNIKSIMDKLTEEELSELFNFMMEEVEQIDELSKKTLGSYVKKANRDTYLAGKFSGTDKEARAAGRKRKAGVAMAVDKLTKEEVEALDEVSGAKLGSYMVKARKNHDSSMEKRNDAIDAGDKDTARKLGAVAQKRKKGMGKAIDKLTGSSFGAKVHATEEVEAIDEAADLTKIDTKKLQSMVQMHKHYGQKDPASKAAADRGEAELKRRMTKEEAPVDMIAQLADFISREAKKK